MKFSEFIKKYEVGKSYAYKGTYKGECVSLVKNYIYDVLNAEPVSIGNAKEYWEKRNGSYIKSIFKPLKKGEAIKRGDVFVRTSGKFGHIGIVIKADKQNIHTLEQNNGGCRVVKKMVYPITTDFHYLRPLNQKNIVEKKNKPTVKAGKNYYFSTEPFCYKDTTKKNVYLINEITNLTCAEKARLQKGTKVKPDKVLEVGNDLWITFTKKHKTVFALVYNYEKDKSYIK